MITSEMSGGGLKVTYEKHVPSNATLQMELERITPAPELPTKRSRFVKFFNYYLKVETNDC